VDTSSDIKKKKLSLTMRKICGTGKMSLFLKHNPDPGQDPDPVLKFWFAGSGSGRKWTGSATLEIKQFALKMNAKHFLPMRTRPNTDPNLQQ